MAQLFRIAFLRTGTIYIRSRANNAIKFARVFGPDERGCAQKFVADLIAGIAPTPTEIDMALWNVLPRGVAVAAIENESTIAAHDFFKQQSLI